MSRILYYLFDPLCGWCYGAGATVGALSERGDVVFSLLPSGLFQDGGARPMDESFAAFAWANDQRIERLSGQRFTERYRSQVLSDRRQRFDSGPATLALTSVWMTSPEREAEALTAIQQARYVDGQDITRIDVLGARLDAIGLPEAAATLVESGPALLEAARGRIAEAQALMRRLGAQGVPSFVLDAGQHQTLLDASLAYGNPSAFIAQATAAPQAAPTP